MQFSRLAIFASAIFIACNVWAQGPDVAKPDELGPEVSGADAKSVLMPLRVFDSAMDPSTGIVAAIDGKADGVYFFPALASAASVEKPIELKLGGVVAAVTFKRYGNGAWFLAVCPTDKTLYIIDPIKLQISAKIKIDSNDQVPTSLSAVQAPSSPYAYVFTESAPNINNNIGECFFRRINLATQTDEGAVTPSIEDRNELVVSGDGNWIYGRGLIGNPAGFRAFRFDRTAKAPTVALLTSIHQDSSRYIADPFGLYVISGTNIYAPNLRDGKALIPPTTYGEWKILRGIAAHFLTDRPVFFFRAGTTIGAYSYNTLKPLTHLTIPDLDEPGPPKEIPGQGPRESNNENLITFGMVPRPYYANLMASKKDDALVVIDGKRAAVVPISAFKLPDDPMLFIDVQGSTVANCNEPMTLKLVKLDPRTTVSLGDAPAGAKLTNDTLTWTPSADDVGEKAIAIKLASADGKIERTQDIGVIVQRSAMQLDFTPGDIKFSPDGKFALLLGSAAPDRFAPRYPAGDNPAPSTRLAILDIAQRKIVADRTFALNSQQAAIGADNVYLGLQDSDAFYVLSRKDLSDVKRIFTKGRISAMTVVGTKSLYVSTNSMQNTAEGGTTAYNLPDLTTIETTQFMGYRPYGNSNMPVAVDGNWYYKGLLYDQNFDKVRMVIQPDGFIQANQPSYQRNYTGEFVLPVATWGVQISGNMLRRQGGQTLGTVKGLTPVILPDVPLCAALMVTSDPYKNDGTVTRTHYQLSLCDLFTAETVGTLPLLEEPMRRNQYQGYEQAPSHLFAQPGLLMVQLRDRLYFLSANDLPVAKAVVPMRFPLEQSAFVADVDQPLTLDMKAVGGKGPLEYSITPETPAINIDKATGRLTVDASKDMEKYLDAISQSLANMQNFQQTTTTMPATPEARIAMARERYHTTIAGQFKAITGNDPKGVPIVLPLTVIARDSEQLGAELNFSVIVDVPTDRVEARLKKTEEDRAKQQAAAQQVQRDYEERMRASMQPTVETSQLQSKIADLEKRNAQLEAQVQVLKELLGQQISPPATTQSGTRP